MSDVKHFTMLLHFKINTVTDRTFLAGLPLPARNVSDKQEPSQTRKFQFARQLEISIGIRPPLHLSSFTVSHEGCLISKSYRMLYPDQRKQRCSHLQETLTRSSPDAVAVLRCCAVFGNCFEIPLADLMFSR